MKITHFVTTWALALMASLSVSKTFASTIEDTPPSQRLGPLDAIVIEYSKDAPYVVYLHGFGGIGEDAYDDLKVEINKNKVLKQVNWIFPNAPQGGWFNIQATNRQTYEPDYQLWQETLKPTRRALTEMIKSAKINPQNVIWAGFSQGAITAIDYVLHASVSPKGLIVNSGIYFDSTDWNKQSPHLKGVRFFMNHDPNDSALPFELAKKAETLMRKSGMIGKLNRTKDDHTLWTPTIRMAVTELLKPESAAPNLRSRARAEVCGKFF